ncbi:MAG: sulfatase-like hydrolase/transferase, partial [Planctomycetales bacterium]
MIHPRFLRFPIGLVCSALLLIAGLPASISMAAGDETGQTPPNFIVVLVDDLGWTDLGCYGSKYYETPFIDQLAEEGMRLTNAYAACAVCSPTRAALLTGRYPARHGITDWMRPKIWGGTIPKDGKNPSGFDNPGLKLLTPKNHLWMELNELTFAEILRKAGYATCHIGKWHLGAEDWYPDKQGFNHNLGGNDYGQPPRYFYPYGRQDAPAMPGLETGTEGEYLTDREAAEAVTFIRDNQDKPFLLYLAHYAVHTPIQAKPELTSKFEAKEKAGQKSAEYASMIASVDESMGRILATLDELDLSDNTIIMLTSDNGGLLNYTNNTPLR